MRVNHDKARLNGDDLRAALAFLADFEPNSQRVLDAVLAADEPSAPRADRAGAHSLRRSAYLRLVRIRAKRSVTVRAGLAAGMAVAVAVLVVMGTLAASGGGSQVPGAGQSAGALRRAILTAFRSTLSEISALRTRGARW